MAGLEVILQTIADDSQKQCAAILARARQEAEELRTAAEQQADAQSADVLAQAQKQAEGMLQKADSAAKTIQSRALLAEKVAIIDEVLAEAVAALKSLPDDRYAATMQTLAVRYARPGEGVLRVSPEDAARLPVNFESSLNARLAGQGAALHVQTVPQAVGGFVLVYGDMEQNCTVDALLSAMRDELKDSVNRALFA